MKPIIVRLAQPNEQMFDWGSKGEDNYFDPIAALYPATQILKTTQEKETILYMPVQTIFVMDSLAINPNLKTESARQQVSVSLKELVICLRLQAQQRGIGELHFLGTNEKTNKFASDYGFEALPWQVYRMKIFDEEESYGNNEAPNLGRTAR